MLVIEAVVSLMIFTDTELENWQERLIFIIGSAAAVIITFMRGRKLKDSD